MSETQQRRSGGGDRRGRDDRRGQAPKEENKYLERVVTINRVAKVVQCGEAEATTTLMDLGNAVDGHHALKVLAFFLGSLATTIVTATTVTRAGAALLGFTHREFLSSC